MKKIILSSILFIAFAAISIAQNGAMFEFKITSTQGATGSIKVYYSSPGCRTEMQINVPQFPNGGFAKTSITKSDKPTTSYSIDDKSKTYTIIETKPATPTTTGNADDYTVKIVGKEKVGNYNCTHAIVTKGTQSNEFWTTTEITEFEKYSKTRGNNKFMGTGGEYNALVKNGAGGFMVKTLTNDPRGGIFTMELVKFEKKDLVASLFEVPADYTEMTGTPTAVPGMPNIDVNKIQNMTPEERAKYIEDMKKQYGAPTTPPKQGN